MPNELRSLAVVSVFTRHTSDFPHKNDRYYKGKGCRCRKSLYINEDGKDRRISARTRSWEQAEKAAQAEREKRDPALIELRKSLEAKAAKKAAEEAADAAEMADAITIERALKLWTAGFKDQSLSTAKTYRIVVRKISSWALLEGIVSLRDVTPAQLDQWRSEWSLKAIRKEDRMGPTTQNQFVKRVKAFFRWAYEIEHIGRDPAKALKSIVTKPEQTMPLTQKQFDLVMAAVDRYDADQRRAEDQFGTELRALCLTMRWTGLRLPDVLMLPRTALTGNSLSLTVLKSKADAQPVLPDQAVAALKAIQPRRGVAPNYFFWSGQSTHITLGKKWAARIKRLNRYLALIDDHGQPMQFHSHMLRDTFAVELLLADVPIETVSKLLTHKSIRVTELHYAPWVKSRQRQLRDKAIDALQKMGATFSAQFNAKSIDHG